MCVWLSLDVGGVPHFSRLHYALFLFVAVLMPGETLLVEGNDYLWALVIGFFRKHQVRLVRVLPANEG